MLAPSWLQCMYRSAQKSSVYVTANLCQHPGNHQGLLRSFFNYCRKFCSFYFRFYYSFQVSGSITDFCLSGRRLAIYLQTNNIKKLNETQKKTNTVIQKIRTDITSSFIKTITYKIKQISKPNVLIILCLNKKLSTKMTYR